MSEGFRSISGKMSGRCVMSSGCANSSKAVFLKLRMLIERWSASEARSTGSGASRAESGGKGTMSGTRRTSSEMGTKRVSSSSFFLTTTSKAFYTMEKWPNGEP